MRNTQFPDPEPTDPKALQNLDLAKKVNALEVDIDIKNQTLWVHTGHTLKDGSIFPTIPKVRYFKNQGGK